MPKVATIQNILDDYEEHEEKESRANGHVSNFHVLIFPPPPPKCFLLLMMKSITILYTTEMALDVKFLVLVFWILRNGLANWRIVCQF